MRSAFIRLSTNGAVRAVATKFPPSVRASRRFIAGETLAEALSAVRVLNQEGKKATLDYLGENVSSRAEADHYTKLSEEILESIARERLDCNLSIKLTAMGLDLGGTVALENLKRLLTTARRLSNFIRIDMEGSLHTQATIDLFMKARAEFSNVGIVIQSYLRRSEGDIAALAASGAAVRLCKGAYKEPPEVAFPEKSDVDGSYKRLLGALLAPESIARGTRPAIATHDPAMIAHAKELIRNHGTARERFEFQMLYGIRRDLQKQLVSEGFTLRVYVPFGEAWYPYFMRRLAERPANVGFILKNLWRDSGKDA